MKGVWRGTGWLKSRARVSKLSRKTPALEHKGVRASLSINRDFLILRRIMEFERLGILGDGWRGWQILAISYQMGPPLPREVS